MASEMAAWQHHDVMRSADQHPSFVRHSASLLGCNALAQQACDQGKKAMQELHRRERNILELGSALSGIDGKLEALKIRQHLVQDNDEQAYDALVL